MRESVRVEIEPRPAVTDVERAVADGAPMVWPDAPNNLALTWRYGDRAAVEKAFTQAAHVTKLKLVNNRVITNGRPVKWSGTRAEHFLSDNHARDAVIEAALALDASGRFLAIKATLLDGIGAYCSCHGAHISIRNTTNGLPLMYDVPLLDVEIRLVLTNTAPIGPYRGAGREQASYITERLVDQAGRELGIDAVDLRRRNLVPATSTPYKSAAGQTYDSGDFEGLLDKTLALADWDG